MGAVEWITSAFFTLAASVCPGPVWSDPANDLLDPVYEPRFDLTDISIRFEPVGLVLELSFDPSTVTSLDLKQLSGFVDFDTDSNASTGEPSHIDQFGLEPPLEMGVDYFLEFTPELDQTELKRVADGLEESVAWYPIQIEGTRLEVRLPRCGPAPCAGIVIGGRFQLSVLLGNYGGPTDRAPNGTTPYTAIPVRGDFDEDGDVDGQDYDHFSGCTSGPAVPNSDPECQDADFDGDRDIDQDDFGAFQLSFTGSCD